MLDFSLYIHSILSGIYRAGPYIVCAAVTAVVFYGVYSVLVNGWNLPSMRSILIIRALTASTRDIALSDRLVVPVARKIEPHIQLNPYTKNRLEAELRSAGMAEISPERYTAMSIAFGVLVLLPGLAFVFAGVALNISLLLIVATGLIACSVVAGISKQREVRRIAKRRRGRIELEIPKMTDSVLHSLSKHERSEDVKKILRDYQRIAGPDMAKEISYILAEIETASIGGVESAFRRAEIRLNSDNARSLLRGLIGINNGEDMRTYLEGIAIEMNEGQIEFATRVAKRRPNELIVPIWIVMGAMALMIFVLIGTTVITDLPLNF